MPGLEPARVRGGRAGTAEPVPARPDVSGHLENERMTQATTANDDIAQTPLYRDYLNAAPRTTADELVRNLGTDGPAEFMATGPLGAFNPALRFGRALVDELRIAVLDAGLWYRAVDPANVALAEAWVPADRFKSYEVTTPGVLGVNLGSFGSAFHMLNSNDRGTMVGMCRDAEDDAVTVRYSLPDRYQADGAKTTHHVRLIPPGSIRKVPSDLLQQIHQGRTFAADIPVYAAGKWAEFVKETGGRKSHMAVHAAEGATVLEGKRDSGENPDLAFKNSTDPADVTAAGSLFSNDYLKDMLQAPLARHAKELTARAWFGEEYPMAMVMDLPGVADPDGGDDLTGGYMMFCLAPRIQSDAEDL